MHKFRSLFPVNRTSVIGMVHVRALPGTPRYSGSMDKIVKEACSEAEILVENNIDGIIIENMHDVPYIKSINFGPEIVAAMCRISSEIRRIIPKEIPCGIQILSSGNTEAVAISKVCSLDFIRAEGFVFGHIGDEGYCDANAGNLLRYRKKIDAENILVFSDIKKKHSSHALTSDVSLAETAKAAEFFLSDGIIVTGNSTADPANLEDFKEVKGCTTLPVLIGSGVTLGNLCNYSTADALIVGSYFKIDGKWHNPLDAGKVKEFMQEVNVLCKISEHGI